MRDLVAGERVPLPGERTLDVALAGQDGVGGDLPVLALLALGPDRRVSAAFPPIDGVRRELRPAARFDGAAAALHLDLAAMPDAVERLVLVAFDPDNRPIARALTIATAALRFAIDLRGRADAAVLLIELYRHQGGWRLSANGQGFATGLSAVAAAHGVDPAWVAALIRRNRPSAGDVRPPGGGSGSGSGIAVERHHILTNAHVVDDARSVTVHVAGRASVAEVVFADPRNDLALLHLPTAAPGIAAFRPQVGLHLGEDVVAIGFPLQGLLGSGPHASAGNIAALCGVGNDSSMFQFTAPIASGNSGGPILDMAGHLVGLVCSSLDLDRVRRAGANAENINFGIKSAIMLSFLDAFGIEPVMAPVSDRPIGRAAVVQRARDAIARITVQC